MQQQRSKRPCSQRVCCCSSLGASNRGNSKESFLFASFSQSHGVQRAHACIRNIVRAHQSVAGVFESARACACDCAWVCVRAACSLHAHSQRRFAACPVQRDDQQRAVVVLGVAARPRHEQGFAHVHPLHCVHACERGCVRRRGAWAGAGDGLAPQRQAPPRRVDGGYAYALAPK